jgi:hypothetical protein
VVFALQRRPECDTSESHWASAGPRIISHTWFAHRSNRGGSKTNVQGVRRVLGLAGPDR